MGWGKEGPAPRSISRQKDILEQGCQVLGTTHTSFPSPSTPQCLVLYIKELKVSEVANITFSRSWLLRACAPSTLSHVLGRQICRQKSVVCVIWGKSLPSLTLQESPFLKEEGVGS